MTWGPICSAVNASLLYLQVCSPSDCRLNGALNSYTKELLHRDPQFGYQLFDQPITTFFDPTFDFKKFPAVRQWLYTGWRKQRVDELLRLHDTPGAVTPESLFLQFAPVYGSNNNIVGYLPHTSYAPSYKGDLLRMYVNSTSEYDYMAFYVDGKQAFLPDLTSPYGSPRVLDTELECNGVHNPISKFIRSSDPYMSYPQLNALEYLQLHPAGKLFRKLLAASCPPYLPLDSCKWEGIAGNVFTLLFATDEAFKNINPAVLDYIFSARDVYNSDSTRWLLALRILENHILGSPTKVFGKLTSGLPSDPLSALLDQDPSVACTECSYSEFIYNLRGLLHPGCKGNVRPFPSYWYIDQMRDISRINGTLFARTYLEDSDGKPRFLGAYDYQNGYKFRVPGVQACDFAYAQYPYVDIELSNALVHKVNNVLIPEDVYTALQTAGFNNIYVSCPNVVSRPNYQYFNGRDWTTTYGENVLAAAAEDTTTDTPATTTTDTTTTVQQPTTQTGGNTQNLGAAGDIQASGAGSVSAVVGTALGAVAAVAAML